MPAHRHVAGQTREVEDRIAAHGRRPIDRLLGTVEADARRWCLVHATHADAGELARIAKAHATVGLCPISEADLGDGVLDAASFLAQGGHFGIGSDSLIRISVADELRTLEYGQRLMHQATAEAETSGITPGSRADFVVLDRDHPALAAAQDDTILDAWLFAADNAAIRTVSWAGLPMVRDGRHVARERLGQRYRKALASLA